MTTYYVKNAGSDSNSGLSDALAWQTINKVNTSSFNPGDSILFNKGDTWREQLTIPSSGSAGNPITFGSYGSGNAPQILGSDALGTWTFHSGADPVGIYSCSHIGAVTQLWFKNASDGKIKWGNLKANHDACITEYDWYYASNVVYCYAATDPDSRYTFIEGATTNTYCITHNSKAYITIQDLEIAFGGNYGIRAGHGDATNWTITRNTIHHFGTWPVGESNSPGTGISPSKSHVISDNKIYECGQAAIYTYGYSADVDLGDFTINNNEIYNCYYVSLTAGMMDGGIANNCIIKYNEIYDTPDYADTTKIHNGISSMGNATHPLTSWNIYYNLIHDLMGVGIKVGQYTTNFNVLNNTVYKSNDLIPAEFSSCILVNTTGVSGIIIKNNIGMDFKDGCLVASDKTVISSCDNNLWYQSGSYTGYTDINGITYHYNDQTAYKTATGFDTNGLWEDPLFISTSDFHLQGTSPCRNAGVDVGLTLDYDGVSVPQETYPAIGAYEYAYVSASLSPSASPSVSPSVSPSGSPSLSPSASPSLSSSASQSPSVSPSISPSLSPSVSPSVSLSISPSVSSSVSPSISPSLSLSVSPSVSPSSSPSLSPSASQSPSQSPSVSPSISPSSSPSTSPSRSPSMSQSESASASPSLSPSQSSSVSPSISPSASPSIAGPPFVLVGSTYIVASGENTTGQLTSPAGKDGTYFQAGRIQDDENPADAIDLASDKYTEIEWCIKATDEAEVDATYEFRITKGVAWNPTDIGGCVLWLRSDLAWQDAAKTVPCTTDSLIYIGEDKSGLGHDLVQATEAKRFIYKTNQLNGYSSWRSDAVDDYMKSSTFTWEKPEMVYIVFKPIIFFASDTIFDGNAINGMRLFQHPSEPRHTLYPTSEYDTVYVNLTTGTWAIARCRFETATSGLRKNNGTEVVYTSLAGDANGLTLAAYGDWTEGFGSFDYAEIIGYNVIPSSAEDAAMMNYLNTRYAIY